MVRVAQLRPTSFGQCGVATTSAATATASSGPLPTITSPDGSCGTQAGGVYLCPTGTCCSQFGFCGSTTAHCGDNCQKEFGTCSTGSAPGRCGPHDGGSACPAGECCSVHGFCGKSDGHCGIGCRKDFGVCNQVTIPSPPAAKSGPICHVTDQRTIPAVNGNGADRAPMVAYECNKPGVFALTYDDGVLKNYDPYLLDVLKAYDVRATWFINGKNWGDITTPETKSYVKRIFDEGHDLSSHSYSSSHPHMPQLSANDQINEIKSLDDAIFDIVGKHPALFRPPYGEYDANTLRALKDMGYNAAVIWNTDTLDYQTLSVEKSLANVQESIDVCVKAGTPGMGSILELSHSFPVSTVNYTLQVIPKLYEAGYRIVTVGECIGQAPYRN
ncbi:hypothetical protein BJ742DRAFT_453101 [Cladochytrium replicatum]|nr:hypothetical protein BJ742DRAFT_453101 [Cladochytrium replicatum]